MSFFLLLYDSLDLPVLHTIELGLQGLQGDKQSSLVMKSILKSIFSYEDLPALRTLKSKGCSFYYVNSVQFEGNLNSYFLI